MLQLVLQVPIGSEVILVSFRCLRNERLSVCRRETSLTLLLAAKSVLQASTYFILCLFVFKKNCSFHSPCTTSILIIVFRLDIHLFHNLAKHQMTRQQSCADQNGFALSCFSCDTSLFEFVKFQSCVHEDCI